MSMNVREIPNEVMFAEVRRLVAEGKKVTFKAKGNSMLPFIRGGEDSVVIAKAADVVPGDILLCEVADGRYVLHRLIFKDGDRLLLMGDGNIKGTEACRMPDVVGRAECILRAGKTIRCNSRRHRFGALVWRRLLPLRRYLLFLYRLIYIKRKE